MATQAVQHIRRMRGGAQSHLLLCSDGHYYVVKFRNNPQHYRVLANEYIASKLARQIGVPVPDIDLVEVSEAFLAQNHELSFVLGNRRVRCEAGLQFGSRYVVSPLDGQVFDYLPPTQFYRIRNVEAFAGILAFDKWTSNVDTRQSVFGRALREKKYTATFIDHGYCFNAGEWTFEDAPLRGVFPRNEVYAAVTGWESFEPWMTRTEELGDACVWNVAQGVPPEWYGSNWGELESLVENLLRRRRIVRSLISAFRKSTRHPFPAWSIAA